MKIKKMVLASLLICGLVAGWSLSAGAVVGWYTCTVNSAGPFGAAETNTSWVYLTDTAETANWVGSKAFSIPGAKEKTFLAVALAAIASGKKVSINADPQLANPTLRAIYLLDQ